MGLALFVLGPATLGLLLFSRSMMQSGFAMPALDFVHLEPSLSLRQMSCLGPFLFSAGLACPGLLAPALDLSQPAPLLSLHGFACFDFSILALDFAKSDPSLLAKSLG